MWRGVEQEESESRELGFLLSLVPSRNGEEKAKWEACLKGCFPKNIFSHIILFLFIVWLEATHRSSGPQCAVGFERMSDKDTVLALTEPVAWSGR